jgi:hypothetical protein
MTISGARKCGVPQQVVIGVLSLSMVVAVRNRCSLNRRIFLRATAKGSIVFLRCTLFKF